MGTSPVSRCSQCPAAALGRCPRDCTEQFGAEIVSSAAPRTKLCSWVDEELTYAGDAASYASAGLDLPWFGHSGGSAGGQPSKALLDPGSLIRIHGRGGRGEASSTRFGLDSLYALEKAAFARGSYGELYNAKHNRTGMRRAVKSVSKQGLRRYVTDVGAFVRREVKIMTHLDHPNIVRLYEAFEDQSALYLVLELCEGGDLLERVAVARDRMPEREAAILLAQMLGAMQHLYLRGIVHRDVKPENFLFCWREPEREPLPPERAPLKLIDFGLSRRLSFEAGGELTAKIGTVEYMAPETYAGCVKEVLADRTDMWSIGVVLHVIFIGHFPSPRLADMTTEEYLALPCWSGVSASGRQLLGQLLRREPTQRPTVTVAMKHPWLAPVFSYERGEPIRSMPLAVRSFASSPGLRRLALVAAAREADDSDIANVRRLFQLLELECDGSLSRQALERASWLPGVAGSTAAELSRFLDLVNCSGSGSVEWTELLAVVFGLALSGGVGPSSLDSWGSAVDAAPAAAATGGGLWVFRDTDVESALCAPKDATVWAAFDLLSGGGDVVTGASLACLLAPPRVPPARAASLPRGSHPGQHDSGAAFSLGPPVGPHLGAHGGAWDGRGAGTGSASGAAFADSRGNMLHAAEEDFESIEAYSELVHEVDDSGALDAEHFVALVRGLENLEETGGTCGGAGSCLQRESASDAKPHMRVRSRCGN